MSVRIRKKRRETVAPHLPASKQTRELPGILDSLDTHKEQKPARTSTQEPAHAPPTSTTSLDQTIQKALKKEFHPSTEFPFPTESLPSGETNQAITPPSSWAEEDWLPARMLNEFVYCPRLFFYEHVDGIFVHNADTERGKDIHTRVDSGTGSLPAPSKKNEEESDDETPTDHPPKNQTETIHSRSVQMSSASLGVVAKLDLVESSGGEVSPVDYKAGAPREGGDIYTLWPADKMQLGLQMGILRENGYCCRQGFIYYRSTKQRIPLEWSSDLESWLKEKVASARDLLRSGKRPAPLVDSPKCIRCSLAPICLPDETYHLRTHEDEDLGETKENASPPPLRRLIAARSDERALYLNTQGLHVGVSDHVLVMKEKDRTIENVRLSDVHHVAVFGNVQISTQAVQRMCREDIPITWLSMGGWFYGITRGHSLTNILLRRSQFSTAGSEVDALKLARYFIFGKIRNARKMLMRNATTQPLPALQRLRQAAEDALQASSAATLLGIEGAAAAVYFSQFSAMIKADDEIPGLESSSASTPLFNFHFQKRNRRPPTDPVNALLSFAYSLLAKDCTVALLAVGFDPWMGFYHQPRPGRPALALDLMEEFRPLIAESAVLSAINNRVLAPTDFIRAGDSVNLTPEGRKKFLYAYERRMSHLIVHPVFAYKVSYRRALELQARILARVLEREIPHYIPFLTR